MNSFKATIVSLAILSATTVSAQKVRLLDGSLEALKGVTKINVQFDYSKMGVGKFETEEEYINKKKEDYNKKESGKGDDWARAWKADRKNRFEPQFKELFAKYCDINMGDNRMKNILSYSKLFIQSRVSMYM